jgi:hypothetical protein
VETGIVRYEIKNANNPAGWTEVKAQRQDLDDRLLLNDRRVHRFTATLRDLEPGTAYAYTIGGAAGDPRTEPAEFTTAPAGPEPFTFIFLSDTHSSPETRDLLAMATAEYPRTAFCTISGDLVGTGQYRDDWDTLFGVSTHAHGMYQLEFYHRIAELQPPPLPLLSGIIGDAWAGAVEVGPVQKAAIRDLGQFTGSLLARSQVTVAPKISGRLEKLPADLGDEVQNGQLIAILDAEEPVDGTSHEM